MSRDSSNSVLLKLVISVNCLADSELVRYRHGKGCFSKPIVALSFPYERFFYDVSVASYKVRNLQWCVSLVFVM